MNVALHAISLCAGHAGIDLGTSLASELADVGCRTVCYVERESYAAAAVVARMEDAHLEQAPVYSDITTFDGRRWRGCVDIVLAGFPCQPFSVAGRRAGTEDERHLWPHVLRIFRESGARLLLLENVPGLISTRTLQHRSDLIAHLDLLDAAAQRAPRPRDRWKLQEHRDRLYGRLLQEHGISALHYVLCGLEEIGAATAWGLFSAEEVGAPHERLRVFILAELADGGCSRDGAHESEHVRGCSSAADAGACGGHLAYGSRERATRWEVPTRSWTEGQGTPDTDWDGRHLEHPMTKDAGKQSAGNRKADNWQTPAADSFRCRGGDRADEQGLDQQARLFPTPASRDFKGANGPDHLENGTGRLHMDQLPNFIEHSFRLPPTTSPDGSNTSEARRVLNPRFVEALMGWPIGWTSCAAVATASFQSWRRTHLSALFAICMRGGRVEG